MKNCLTTDITIFNSEPHSILAPEAPPIPKEELERMIREKMGDKDAGDGKPAQSQIMPQQERYKSIYYMYYMQGQGNSLEWL